MEGKKKVPPQKKRNVFLRQAKPLRGGGDGASLGIICWWQAAPRAFIPAKKRKKGTY